MPAKRFEYSQFTLPENEIKEIIAFLKEEFIMDDDIQEFPNSFVVNSDLNNAEIFKLGMEYGEKKERAKWTKPCIFFLDVEYADVLKEAIRIYSKENYIAVDSISIEKCNDQLSTIKISPTDEKHLFSIARQYGMLCEQIKTKRNETEKH